ncbi:hypothetical protein LC048_11565 [Mesobacillus subterraneus]|uniref:hypothetical protein n=1 Tax=Mesobacillus subterraneus TaxID=285983 RepID=UPI001CFCFE68|nr:hypothetical protein [Mesobacillus subterraneus]WLR57428.1 hypothetical protein LC048_11565 [Mesobacillus subterraneus]
MDTKGQSGKRRPSKRVITAKKEMRTAHFLHEFDEDDNDWKKERKHNIPNSHSSSSKAHDYRLTKLKNREAYKPQRDEY